MLYCNLTREEAQLLSNMLARCASGVIEKVTLYIKEGVTIELSSVQKSDSPYEHPVHLGLSPSALQRSN